MQAHFFVYCLLNISSFSLEDKGRKPFSDDSMPLFTVLSVRIWVSSTLDVTVALYFGKEVLIMFET